MGFTVAWPDTARPDQFVTRQTMGKTMSRLRLILMLMGLFHVADAIYTATYHDTSPLKSIVLASIMSLAALLGRGK